MCVTAVWIQMYLLTDSVVLGLVLTLSHSCWAANYLNWLPNYCCKFVCTLSVKLGSKNNPNVSETYKTNLAAKRWQKLLQCLHNVILFADSDDEAVVCVVLWWPLLFTERLHSSTYPRCCEFTNMLQYCILSLLFWFIDTIHLMLIDIGRHITAIKQGCVWE